MITEELVTAQRLLEEKSAALLAEVEQDVGSSGEYMLLSAQFRSALARMRSAVDAAQNITVLIIDDASVGRLFGSPAAWVFPKDLGEDEGSALHMIRRLYAARRAQVAHRAGLLPMNVGDDPTSIMQCDIAEWFRQTDSESPFRIARVQELDPVIGMLASASPDERRAMIAAVAALDDQTSESLLVSIIQPLLRRIADLGTRDIYTDAPETAPQVNEFYELLQIAALVQAIP